MRESSLWTYAIVNLVHILGIAMLFGAILTLDLRLMGAWKSVPLASLSRPLVRVAASGVGVALVSGVMLLSTNATEYAANPFLFAKFAFIALGLVNIALLHGSAPWRAHRRRDLTAGEERQLALMGGASLFFWLCAITSGRMIGYW